MCSKGSSALDKSNFPTKNPEKVSCVQLCFSPNNTLYLHHVLIHYTLLFIVILRISLGVNFIKPKHQTALHSVNRRTSENTLTVESVQ